MSQNIPFPFNLAGTQSAAMSPNEHVSGIQSSQQSVQPSMNGQIPTQPQLPPGVPHPSMQMPGADLAALSALQGVSMEQLTLIARLIQSGALTIPAAPNAVDPSLVAASPAISRDAPAIDASTQPRAPTPASQDDMDMDKEEGELEEGEEPDTNGAREFLRPPPTGPRKRSISPRDPRLNVQSGVSAERKTHPMRTPSNGHGRTGQNTATPSRAPGSGKRSVGRDEASRAFVKTMYQAGYTFDQLAKEIPNPRPLRRMFDQLGLSTEAAATPRLITNGIAAAPPAAIGTALLSRNAQPADTRHIPAAKQAVPVRSAAPVARSDYLAKLKALQSRKPENTAGSSTPKLTGSEATQTASTTQQVPAVPNSGALTVKPIDKNELLRKKIEALKALQAAKSKAAKPSSSASTVSTPQAASVVRLVDKAAAHPSSISTDDPDARRDVVAAQTKGADQVTSATMPAMASSLSQTPQPVLQTIPPAATPTIGRSFSSLPGLFMIGTPVQATPAFTPPQHQVYGSAQQPTIMPFTSGVMPASVATKNPSPAASPAPLMISRKRPVASDFDHDISDESVPSAKRAVFGQSRSGSESERLVIEVSEGEDDEMELDEPADMAMPQSPVQTKPLASMGPLRDFPPRPTLYAQPSTPGTPPVTTPGSAARYAQTMADIEEIKRKIAEKEAAKLNIRGVKGAKDASSPGSGVSTPTLQTARMPSPSAPANGLQSASASVGKNNFGSDPSALARKQEKEKWRRRILELEQEGLRRSSASAEPSTSSFPVEAPPPQAKSAQPQTEDAIQEQPVIATTTVPNEGPGDVGDDGADGVNSGTLQLSLGDHAGIGSQTTTITGTCQLDANSQANSSHQSTPSLNPLTSSDAIPADAGSTVVTIADVSVPTRTEEDSNEDDVSEDVEMDESSSDDDDDERESDDGSTDDTGAPHANLSVDVVNQNVADLDGTDQVDNLSVSSENSEEYEPDPMSFENTHEQALRDESKNAVGLETASSVLSNPIPVEVSAATAELGSSRTSQESSSPESAPAIDDELAPELQPPVQEQTPISHQEIEVKKSYYTPYQSALSRFKDYRYHPDYLDSVPGGFKSLTYSNNVDPITPLCQYELAGGRCNDSKCEYQHFGNMSLSDNDLLKLLGTHNTPVETLEEEKRWREGLSAVVRQLRLTNSGKDAGAIAARIAEFRRDFIGDDTKVLHLRMK